MQAALRQWITVGLALTGAGAIAAIPLAASMHHTQTPDVQLTTGTDPFVAWSAVTDHTEQNLGALIIQLPGLLVDGAPAGAPDAETLFSHGLLYPIHDLGTVLPEQFDVLLGDLANIDPVAFVNDLISAPAVELDAVLNGEPPVAGGCGDALPDCTITTGLLTPITIPDVANGQTEASLGTFSNLAAVIGDLINGTGLGDLFGGLDFGL